MEIAKCTECDKEITGYGKSHVDYMMKQHKLSKHERRLDEMELTNKQEDLVLAREDE